MAFTHKYTLICDDMRREDNGKLIIIGLYTGTVALPQLPFVLPSLTFCTFLESDRPGQWSMEFRLEQLETGRSMVGGGGAVVVQQPGLVIAPIKFGAVQFQAVGIYNFVVTINDGQLGPIITGFSVALNIPPQIGPQQQMPRH
jgi:hypothetical protein